MVTEHKYIYIKKYACTWHLIRFLQCLFISVFFINWLVLILLYRYFISKSLKKFESCVYIVGVDGEPYKPMHESCGLGIDFDDCP